MSDVLNWLASLSVEQVAAAMIPIAGIMVALKERRLSVIALLLQHLLLALFLANFVYLPIAALKGLIGNPICLILYLSSRHVERTLRGVSRSSADEQTPRTWGDYSSTSRSSRGQEADFGAASSHRPRSERSPASHALYAMPAPFRLAVVALGGVAAYGLWRAHPLEMLPPTVNLTSYSLMIMGLLLIATSEDPLRTGLGLLTFFNGFEVAYITLDSSLIVFALLGSIDILIALAVGHAAARWSRAREMVPE